MSVELRGYIVRGGNGRGTALMGYAWTSGKYRLVRASTDDCGQLIVMRFAPTADGLLRARMMAYAVDGTVKRVVLRRRDVPASSATPSGGKGRG